MKLATYKDGSRDGQLVVVSHDLSTAHYANGIASRLQQVLDDWNFLSPQLQDLYVALNQGRARHPFAFDPARCMAPLPRAFHHVAGGAFLHHVEREHQVRGDGLPERLHSAPQMHQASGDGLLGPCDDIAVASEDFGIDVEAGLAAITGDIPRGASAHEALEGVRLLMLCGGVVLRHLDADGLRLHSRPATAFSPVALTPDELGEAWQGGRVHLALRIARNARQVGLCDAGTDMSFHFGQLIAHAARTRPLGSGTIVGTGPASSRDAARGCGCIAGQRTLEALGGGNPSTAYLHFAETLHIEMKRADGAPVFGPMVLKVVEADR